MAAPPSNWGHEKNGLHAWGRGINGPGVPVDTGGGCGWGLGPWTDGADGGWGLGCDGDPPLPPPPGGFTENEAFICSYKCCQIQKLMPPVYHLQGDTISNILCVIGTSDNGIGGEPEPCDCP